MVNKNVTVNYESVGERSIAMLVQIANEFDCSITVTQANVTVNCKSIMGMLTLTVTNGKEINITADGNDEQEAIKRIEEFLKTGK